MGSRHEATALGHGVRPQRWAVVRAIVRAIVQALVQAIVHAIMRAIVRPYYDYFYSDYDAVKPMCGPLYTSIE